MWSQIQRKLYDLIDPNLKLQVHCVSSVEQRKPQNALYLSHLDQKN